MLECPAGTSASGVARGGWGLELHSKWSCQRWLGARAALHPLAPGPLTCRPQGGTGMTALHWASAFARLEIVEQLLAEGADVHVRDLACAPCPPACAA